MFRLERCTQPKLPEKLQCVVIRFLTVEYSKNADKVRKRKDKGKGRDKVKFVDLLFGRLKVG